MNLTPLQAEDILFWLAKKAGYDNIAINTVSDYDYSISKNRIKFLKFDGNSACVRIFKPMQIFKPSSIQYLEFYGFYAECLKQIIKLSNEGYSIEVCVETPYDQQDGKMRFVTLVAPYTSLESLLIEYDLDVSRK